MFDKELFEKKITILDKTIDKILDKAEISADFTGNIAVISFNTPKVAARARKRFPKAKVYFIEESALKCLFGLSGLYYNDEGDLIKMLKNLEQDDLDLYVIANVPYGAIGANITKKIIDAVDFIEYVNLLPANDYKRNKDKDLFNYQSDMEAINDGFADAYVTTHIAKIHKDKVNNMTLDEFERSQYIDRQLDKYFAENSKRNHYAIDSTVTNESVSNISILNNKTSFMLCDRDVKSEKLGKQDSITYKWNIEKSVDANYLLSNLGRSSGGKKIHYGFVKFNTVIEANNFTTFMYSNPAFITKIFLALNVDGSIDMGKWMPKVDWTRSWTVEEILADYGYNADEIQAVMDDLKNFKGMK